MLAAVFPGQGSQAVGMGRDLSSSFPVAREVFRAADEILSFGLSKLCFEGPESELQLTANSQPAILTCSVAMLRVLQTEGGFDAELAAGHSLGEYAALVFAGVLSFEDAVRIVRQRGLFMQEAVPEGRGSMAAIRAAPDLADSLCKEAAQGQVLSPANYNGPAQTVIAGDAAAVDRAVALAGQRGVSAIKLRVSAPFHCSLMSPAAERLRPVLEAATFKDGRIPVVNNVDAKPCRNGDELRQKLISQVTEPVRWEQSVRMLAQLGTDRAIEIGPGKVLTDLIAKIDGKIKATPSYGKGELDALLKEFPRGAGAAPTPSVPAPAPRKEWQQMTQEEKNAELAKLLSFDDIIKRFDAKPHEIYRWISVDKMPTWLVDGALHFHPEELEEWLHVVGDVEKLREKQRLEQQAFEHEKQAPSSAASK